jgi:hypothetical protein
VVPPKVFISFKHNNAMSWVADHAKRALEKRFVDVYRLIDDPRTGAAFTEQIRSGITWADALVALWSVQGSESHYVRYEYRFARETSRPIALLLSKGAKPPADWNSDERYEELTKSILFPRFRWERIAFRLGGEWDELMDSVAAFAREARDGKVVSHPKEGVL